MSFRWNDRSTWFPPGWERLPIERSPEEFRAIMIRRIKVIAVCTGIGLFIPATLWLIMRLEP